MIEHGSIEAFDENGNNYGVPITPIYPFDTTTNKLAGQVKSRAGITLGAKRPYPGGTVPTGLLSGSEWSGTSATGVSVTVRIWDTGHIH
jgi:hypothetical protein